MGNKIKLYQMKFLALVATVAATQYDSMTEDELLVNLESTLNSAQRSEARDDADAAVAKTAAIKNIQKALTARILKRLDDGQPLVEVARKMKAIEGMQPPQRHGAQTWYHAICRARPRERHQDPPKGRRCPRHGQEMRCVVSPQAHLRWLIFVKHVLLHVDGRNISTKSTDQINKEDECFALLR